MSIYAMSRQAARTDRGPAIDEQKASPVDSALAKITAYIPTEVVAIYLALLGIFNPASDPVKWSLFGTGCGLVVVVSLLNWAYQIEITPNAPKRVSARHQAWVIAFGLIAFVAYAFAVPTSPFLSVTGEATQIGAAAAVILAALLPEVGRLKWVGVDPSC